ncbi:MAG: cation-transporting P-type ATPase [Patescibacteria group bacterium]|nr:cation-transporting P-type ATPase [Patescibacteria group bacterium]
MQKQEVLKTSLADLRSRLRSQEEGLSTKEAAIRLSTFGPNVFSRKKISALGVLGRQFKSSLIYLLLIAAFLAHSIGDYRDGTIILFILLINTLLGFFEEYRSEKVIEKLSRFITKQIRVKRDGEIFLIDESKIVPGDVVIVREGDIVPADLRITEVLDLQVNESQLTGESVPVAKRAETEANATAEGLLFAGSVIEKGSAVGMVYATGDETELGSIAKLSTATKKQTQYEKSLQSFSSFLMKIVLLGLIFVFVIKLFLLPGSVSSADLFIFVIALAVSTVPEALPVIATVTLSTGALKLAKQHVVVRRLSAMEDFGNIDLLCTDKTGTLTENKMTVKKISSSDDRLFQIFACAVVAKLKAKKRRTQNSYDDAFLRYVPAEIQKEAQRFRIVQELPFNPEKKRSVSILESTEGKKKYYFLSIGAPEAVLSVSVERRKDKILREIAADGKTGLHQLAIAYKEIALSNDFDIARNERGLKFLGYAGFEDPLRSTAKTTIQKAERLGIGIKVLTGDSREVAEYIGKQIGLVKESDKVYLGDELQAMPEHEFREAVRESSVFARVSPMQKFNIIQVLKESNVVGYQGDGINDAPALKLADVAIAVASATDIAKENADVVILNKSLEVIVNGIKYGRSIFVNINKYIRYTMSNNFGMFIGLSALYLFTANLPILPAQLLLNNLFGDVPLVMVATDSVEDQEVVRPEKHNMRETMFISLILGLPTALFEILYFAIIRARPLVTEQTSLYLFFTFQALAVFYVIRSKKHCWRTTRPSLALNIAFPLAFGASLAVIYIPALAQWLSFTPLPFASVAGIIGIMVIYFLAADYIKVWYYKSSIANMAAPQP